MKLYVLDPDINLPDASSLCEVLDAGELEILGAILLTELLT